MARLPIPGSDDGQWGEILNEYLSQALKSDGTIKDDVVTANAIAPNAVTSSAIAGNAVTAVNIADGSISETLLDASVQTKLNTPSVADWGTITNKPAVIAAGADQAAARTAIGAGTSSLVIGVTNATAKAGDYQPSSTDISNATTIGRALLTAATATAAKTQLSLVKADVGLANVDNTSDATKNSAVATLANKRITKRVGTTTSSATPTINTDNYDVYTITAQAVDITSLTTNLTGTPTDGQTLWIAITGTAARAITWGSAFESSTVTLPTTTVSTSRLDVGFIWNSVTAKWRCIAVA